jgi:hypothetical protein
MVSYHTAVRKTKKFTSTFTSTSTPFNPQSTTAAAAAAAAAHYPLPTTHYPLPSTLFALYPLCPLPLPLPLLIAHHFARTRQSRALIKASPSPSLPPFFSLPSFLLSLALPHPTRPLPSSVFNHSLTNCVVLLPCDDVNVKGPPVEKSNVSLSSLSLFPSFFCPALFSDPDPPIAR